MERLAREKDVPFILYGQNVDDVGDFRPGAEAARERGVRAPLQEAGFTKDDVRALARRWEIPVWDRPAMACLSSRICYGTPVTAKALKMVDRAEAYLRSCGFEQLRVRHHATVARVELPANDLELLLHSKTAMEQLARELVAEIGYARCSLDLHGFRSGSMNEVLQEKVDDDAPLTDARAIESEEVEGVLLLQIRNLEKLADAENRRQLLSSLKGTTYIAADLTYLVS